MLMNPVQDGPCLTHSLRLYVIQGTYTSRRLRLLPVYSPAKAALWTLTPRAAPSTTPARL